MVSRTRLTSLVALALTASLALAASAAGGADARPRGKHRRAHAARHGRVVTHVPRSLLARSRPPLAPSVAAPAPATPGGDPATLSDPPAPPSPPPSVAAVGVQVDETPDYVARLTRASVAAGPVRIQLYNAGEDPHDLRVMREDASGAAFDFPQVAAGATVTRTLTLAAGRYRLFCTLSAPVSHDAAGMHATLVVN